MDVSHNTSRPPSASSLPPRHRRVRSATPLTGPELRELRRNLNLNQEELAERLDVSKAYVQKLESFPGSIPTLMAERASTLKRVTAAVVPSPQPHRHFHDFRRSTKFSQPPLFRLLPACPCGDPGCNFTPLKDGDGPTGPHWWKFQGIRCRKIAYINGRGQIISPPLRYAGDGVPRDLCSKCGRQPSVGKKYRSRLNQDVYSLYCRRRKGDPKNLQHDPPTHFLLRAGRFVPVSEQENETLRGRSRREFPVPKCGVENCPHSGRTMERSNVLRLKRADGESAQIAVYRCRPRPGIPHATYRVLPQGETAERLGMGQYCWTNVNSGEQQETIRDGRPIRAARTMPLVTCPDHNCQLRQHSGSWQVKGKRKSWRAVCPVGGESWYLRSDGSLHARKGSRWKSRKPGPKSTRQDVFREARQLRDTTSLSWSQITKKLDPEAFSRDQRRATDRIRIGAEALKRRNLRKSST